jgi:hypothetical protein
VARVTKRQQSGGTQAPARGGGRGGNAGAAKRKAPPPRNPGGGAVLGYTFPELAGPPPGTFDPGLEAQVRSSQRGLLDLIEKSQLEGHRQHQDVSQKRRELRLQRRQGQGDIRRGRGYAEADARYAEGQMSTSFARDIEDLGIAKQQGEEAYNRALTDMQHRYAAEAIDQQSAAIRQGTAEAGSSEASLAVRSANQGHDTSELEREHRERAEELARREGRIRTDYGTDIGHLHDSLGRSLTDYGIQSRRLNQGTRREAHQLSLAALRANQDRATALSHAKREQGIYQTDVTQQEYFQAHQTNPNVLFPVPSAAGGLSTGAPHVHAPPHPRVGLGRAISYPRRRPY